MYVYVTDSANLNFVSALFLELVFKVAVTVCNCNVLLVERVVKLFAPYNGYKILD